MPDRNDQDESGALADDLFAGAGGWDLGAAELGIHARGVEIMQRARETRAAAGLTTIHDDVWTFWPDGRADGEIASPPCPTFSTSGKGSGRRSLDSVLCAIDDGAYRDLDQLREYPVSDNDDRTRLVLTPLHFATQHDYVWLAWEQVPAVLPVWRACAAVLRQAGWFTWTGYLYSEQYGVPQARKRAVLLASRRGPVMPPTPTHSRYYSRSPGQLDLGVEKWVSMAEGLGYPVDRALRGNQRPEGGRNRVDADGYILRPIDEPSITITGLARSFRWAELPDWAFTRPATTVQGDPRLAAPGHRCMTAGCHPGREPESMMAKATLLAIDEASLLQSFPADHPWQGNKGEQFLQCGNAVPPRMAMHALASVAGVSIVEAAA